jgi:ribosome-associated protein
LPPKSKNSHRAPARGKSKPAVSHKSGAGSRPGGRVGAGDLSSPAPSRGGSKRPSQGPFPHSGKARGKSSTSRSAFGGKTAAARRSQGRVESLPALTGAAAKSSHETARSIETAKAAIDAALDKKALLPVLIDVSSLASYTDFIGIVSGRSDRHVDAIADGVLQAMKARGRTLLGQEGSGSGRWTLLDFGDVVIHVFYHPVREFYDLESLWVDAPRLPLKIPPESLMAQPDALYGNL